MRRFRSVVVPVLLLVLATVGCGASGRSFATGTVSGKLTLKGQPVPAGTQIQFMSESGDAQGGEVNADGTFSVTGVPVGACKVAVSAPAGVDMTPEEAMKASSGEGAAGAGADENAFATQGDFPTKYLTFATSGETVNVQAGDNQYSLDMTE